MQSNPISVFSTDDSCPGSVTLERCPHIGFSSLSSCDGSRDDSLRSRRPVPPSDRKHQAPVDYEVSLAQACQAFPLCNRKECEFMMALSVTTVKERQMV